MIQIPGGLWARFFAAILDSVILTIPSVVIAGPIGSMTSAMMPGLAGTLISLIVQLGLSSVATYFYYLHFYTKTGATPGKAVFKLKVVHFEDGSLLSPRHVVIRELVGKPLSGLILMVGYLMPLFRKDRRALHDLMADSMVIQVADGSQAEQ